MYAVHRTKTCRLALVPLNIARRVFAIATPSNVRTNPFRTDGGGRGRCGQTKVRYATRQDPRTGRAGRTPWPLHGNSRLRSQGVGDRAPIFFRTGCRLADEHCAKQAIAATPSAGSRYTYQVLSNLWLQQDDQASAELAAARLALATTGERISVQKSE